MRRLVLFSVVLFSFTFCKKSKDRDEDRPFEIYSLFQQGSKTRSFQIHLPKSFYQEPNKKFPLVLALHGGGGNAANMMLITGLNNKADSSGFIIVYPEGLENPSGLRTWNAGDCCGANASLFQVDDVTFISRLIDTMVAKYRTDSKRVYATGHSNGAMMCYKLANDLSQKITAIAPNAGAFQMKQPYQPLRNVPVLHINSLLDENARYYGGASVNSSFSGLYNHPVDSCLGVVAFKARCNSGKQRLVSRPLYSVYQWGGCNANMEVKLYLTNDGGHSWPGGFRGPLADSDAPSQAFQNNYVIWEFFKRFSLP